MADSSPDFAFPTKVISQSERCLNSALKKRDNQAVIVALINDCIAENMIDNSKAGQIVGKIDSVIALSGDPTLTAMLNMLNARLLTEIYRDKKYFFDQRNLPDSPLPDDIFLWSGKQIRGKIMDYVEASLTDVPALAACPVSRYESAISIDADDKVLYPSLFDFIANCAINSINSISNSFSLYNSRYLLPAKEFVSAKINPASKYAAAVLNIYARLLENHSNYAPAYIAADLSRLQYVRDHLFYQDSNQYEYTRTVRDLYDRFSDNEYSALALTALSGEINNSGLSQKEWVKTLDAYLLRFPDGPMTGTVKRLREIATCKEIRLSFPSVVPPATPMDFTINFFNVNSASISIYNVTDIPDNQRREAYKSLVPIAILPIGCAGQIPFTVEKKVTFSFPGYGVYMIVPSFEGSVNDRPQNITVSSLATFVRTVGNLNSILVLDRMSGKGVAGAAVNEFTNDRNNEIRQLLGTTDSDGIMNYHSAPDKYSSVIAISKGLDAYSDKLHVYSYRSNNQPELDGRIFTSLPLYHPGDSLQWSAVIYESASSGYQVAPGQEIEISLLDANRQPVDKTKASTDEYGRVDGSFLIPKDRLTGYFFLNIKQKNRRVCSSNVMVSDYVAPEFRITTETVENDSPAKGDVTIRGNVATYSGFNLAGTPVLINLSSQPPFYFRGFNGSSDDVFFSSTVNTDAEGNFKLVISREVLDNAPLPDGLFAVQISATSANGETESASLTFMRSTLYRLSASLKANVIEAPDSLPVSVNVLDYKGEKVDVPVVYSIAAGEDTVVNRAPLPAGNMIPVNSLPSGQYEITLSTADAKLAAPVNLDFIVYRLSDLGTPIKDDMLWSPDGQNIKLDDSRKLKWRFAVNELLTLHYCVASDSGIVETGTFTGKPGYNIWEYTMPSKYEKCEVSIVAYKNNRSYTSQLSLSAPPAIAPIKIKAESFRDRIIPGSSETWKFYVIDDNSTPREAAVMMRMYNAALDALQKDSWYLPRFVKNVQLSVQSQLGYYTYTSASMDCRKGYVYRNFNPSLTFNTWGYSLYAGAPAMLRMSKAAYTSAGSADLNVVREHADEVMVEEAIYDDDDAGVPVMGFSNYAIEARQEENSSGNDFQYRDAVVSGACFFPMLSTDADGHLSVTFTVPNANTLWKVNTIAFTKALDSSTFDASVIASKPVMVSPQVPAFVRLGDTVDVKAMVMNMTDSTAVIDTEIEIFNPVDNSVIASSRSTDTVLGKQSRTVSCSFKVDIAGNAVGYRVKSSTDLYADGEAGLVPVLPSVAPVIEATTFYLSPGQDKIEVPVTVAGKNPSVTLQYTENPAWYVAAALPGLITNESSTAIQAAAAIHSAAIAAGLMRDNPTIETGLREWLGSNRSDSTYLSLLNRNPDLKIMLLESTPWVLDAQSDTERMTRLALLFDRAEIDRVIDANISFLNTLANPDGGLKWMGQSTESSEWATSCVLKLFGQLNNLGYLPEKSGLDNLINNGLSYMDNLVATRLEKYPATPFLSYSVIASLFPNHAVPEKSRRAIDLTLESVSSSWKNATVSQKATYALLLNRFGQASEAKKILESIFDFAQTSPESGMWWPSIGQAGYLWHENNVAATANILEAVDAIMPGSDKAEKIRQWIILQKQATDWRDPISTSTVIAAVLKSSSRWLETAGEVKIIVGDNEVIPSSVEKVSGYFRADLTPIISERSMVKISRNDARQASWGSVINQYEADMNNVAAASVDGLSVTKKILRYTPAGDVEETSELKVGDKVSVQLTVISDRDIDYVAIDDLRGACFLPVEQLPRPVVSQGLYFYLEQRRDCTRIFVDRLRRGKYILSYDLYVTNSGTYSSGIATLQSQYAPELTAHSSSKTLTVRAD